MFRERPGALPLVAALIGLSASAEAQEQTLPPVTVDPPRLALRPIRPALAQQPSPAGASRRTGVARSPSQAAAAPPSPVSSPSRSADGSSPGAFETAAPLPSRTALTPSAAALPANTTIIDKAALAKLPVFSYGDVFRPFTGFDVSNYGQGGVGYGISLRGFTDAEHGRDIAYYVDGVPLNEVSSIHTPNYADLNPILPETVERIEVIRGPFSVEYGDSNLGGTVVVTTKRAEPQATVSLSGGTFGAFRGVATYSQTEGSVLPFLAFEGFRSDEYRLNSYTQRLNSFNKISIPLEGGAILSIRGQVYDTVFDAPSYIRRDYVQSGLVSPRTPQNFGDGGNKSLQNLVANYVIGPPEDELSTTLFYSHDRFNRYTDFGGGQRGQEEERDTAGGRIRKVWTTSLFDILPTQILVGGNWRSDGISVQAGPSAARQLTSYNSNLGITEHNLAGFGQVQVKPFDWMKLTAGARFDQFFYDVSNRIDPATSPNVAPHALSPKAGIAVTPVSWLELYGNYGQGFRSPSAASELLDNPRLNPLKLESREVGAQIRYERVSFLVDAYTTDISNEAFQAAAGLPVQNLGRSRREGMDFEAKYDLWRDDRSRLAIFANYGFVDARLLGNPPSRYVPNVPEGVINTGFEFDIATGSGQRLSGTAYASFIGRKFLDEDGSIKTSPYQRITARLAYGWREGWQAFGQAICYPGSRLGEAAFNFGSGVGATSADVYVSPIPRVTVMAGLSYGFATGGR